MKKSTLRSVHGVRAITPCMSTIMPSKTALKLAAESGADPRTCERALTEGAHVIRTRSVRAAIVSAAVKLRVDLPPALKEPRR